MHAATRAAASVQAGSEELTGALGALSLEPGVHHGLRGLPTRKRCLGLRHAAFSGHNCQTLCMCPKALLPALTAPTMP